PLQNLQPAEVGFGIADATDLTALRRWIIRPDLARDDPFGNPTVFANMHAPRAGLDTVIGKTGPEDPDLSVISVRREDGSPLALLGNFSMHYFGDTDISADYFGLYAEGLKQRLAPDDPEFLAWMSHGCSGDIWRRDYELPEAEQAQPDQIEAYADALIEKTLEATDQIDHHRPESIAMIERRMELDYRTPNTQLLEWAERIVEEMGDRLPETQPEIYAREQLMLHERQQTEIVIQALRIGNEIAIATTPNETYAITGLKIKAASPIENIQVIELANGGDGYIPPPEQHLLGGYNTWAARSAGLEILAEPKITEAAIELLETITGSDRADRRPEQGPAVAAIESLSPLAYYRLDEFSGPRALDASANQLDAFYEPRVLFYLPGPEALPFVESGRNRSAHFAGDRLVARLATLGREYSLSLWFWNGMPDGIREETGWIFARDRDHGTRPSEAVGIGGTGTAAGQLVFRSGGLPDRVLAGQPVQRWHWHHLGFVRTKGRADVFLDGKTLGTIELDESSALASDTLFFAGLGSRVANFAGRLDEVAVFDRALSADEIAGLAGPKN
ncbi:MAG: LamG-like jellyroll fold domain-containing protein, partial [Verrucomicrobiota bacterium]